ncbi:Calmodulin [Taenia crassiceps]|uniref:Calmodulin n=1 Tax=Taenia crassiceps TaxID=6207 RepID=A0ABR4QPR0_9CEST
MPGSPSEESLEELREVFALFDRDHNGYMSLSELKTMMKQFNRPCTSDEAKEIFSNLDKNHDGRIDFREFVSLMQPLLDESKSGDFYFRIAFAFFDKNDDGNITTAELKQLLHNLHLKLTDNEVEEMISEADLDRNGTISYEEFKSMMGRSHP